MLDNKDSLGSIGKEEPTILQRAVSDTASEGFDVKATSRLLRKIDFALIPFLALLYL